MAISWVTIVSFIITLGLGYWYLLRDNSGSLININGIEILPSEKIIEKVSEDILNAVKVTGNKVDAHVIYRGMTFGKAEGVIEVASSTDSNKGSAEEGEGGKKKKQSTKEERYYIFWLPKGGTIKKKDDLLLIVPAESVQIGKGAFLIDSNLNIYPIADKVFFGGRGFWKFVDFVDLRAIRDMIADMAQVQAKYYALNPQTASEIETMKELLRAKRERIREVI